MMEEIFEDNDSGWIKIGVVRDPVTRILSAYLDLVRNWPSESTGSSPDDHGPQPPHRRLRDGDNLELFDAIRKHRSMTKNFAEQEPPEKTTNQIQRTLGEEGEGKVLRGRREMPRSPHYAAVPTVPTFEELVDLLVADEWAAPSAFRPSASLCGMCQSPFDTVIPFETLQVCKIPFQSSIGYVVHVYRFSANV